MQKPGKDYYSCLSSFRPIELLPAFGKLLEKLLIGCLIYAAQSTDAWSQKQFGFRQRTSTSDALRSLVFRIKDARLKKKQVIGVSLDMKAAFATSGGLLYESICGSHDLPEIFIVLFEVTCKIGKSVCHSLTP